MSDFFSSGWSLFIAVSTILGIVACLWLLLVAARRRVVPGVTDNSTGHVWDEDLKELNNPLPRWWMVLFIVTVVFSVGYLYLYPGLGSFHGSLNWSSAGEVKADEDALRKQIQPLYAKYAAMDEAALKSDKGAMAIGERLFVNNCAQCHGSDARGSKGFPNLTDNDWLWGKDFAVVKETIAKGRNGIMPPMGAAVGTAEDVKNVSHYVLSLSGAPHDGVSAQLGKEKFASCAACHGADGKGNAALGAPNLTDKIWLHGFGEEVIVGLINGGKNNLMPAFGERLSAEQIHVLAGYVKSLSK